MKPIIDFLVNNNFCFPSFLKKYIKIIDIIDIIYFI